MLCGRDPDQTALPSHPAPDPRPPAPPVSAWVAALLGVVQGVFMFVPVSSTSHLALVQHWLQDLGVTIPDPDSQGMILFDLVAHAGTVLSIILVMHRRLGEIVREALRDLRDWRVPRDLPTLQLVVMLGLSTAVTGLLGLLIRIVAPEVFGRPGVIAAMLVVTGGVLWWTDRANPSGITKVTIGIALGIGCAQALALLPGLSRSGLTIAAALALGLKRPGAAEYSFVLAIPTILLATAMQAVLTVGEPIDISVSALAIGFAVSALVGVGSLLAVLKLLYAARFRIFTLYVWILAAVVFWTGVGAEAV